ncbi:MAG: heavy metal sensor histidine kinase [Phycisphaerales bacterium]|nr:heavy metal sensor histidine kinase [Phycisphaerales bacterium]
MFRTLGSRLTALATGITLAVSLLVCVALYLGIRYSLYGEVDTFLAGEVMEFHAVLSAAGDDLEDVQRRIRAELGSRQGRDLAFRLLDEKGRVLLTSDPSNGLPDPWPVPARPADDTLFRTEHGSELATRTRTASRWVATDRSARILQATYLLDQVNASLTRYLQLCMAALGAAAVLALIGGRILATRGLRPVADMVSAARRISVQNLRLRLDRTGSGDELDVLAGTFNEMFERLERQVAQLRQFTADAAHELRTPLAALRLNAEVALSGTRSPEELRNAIAECIEEYDRLARIADDLLMLARADAGQEFVRRSRMRLDGAVGDVVDLYAPLAEERGIMLNGSIAGELWIDGDDGRLRQMLGNLLDNAIKHTPAGGRVDVILTGVDGRAELTVRDTGTGIPPEHLPHVFDRFYRADRARTREGGAGLGLAISRTIVEGHRGAVRLESAPGTGTVITVTLPAASAESR